MTTADIARTLSRVAAGLPGGGEDRPGQQAMAAAVARAIEEERHLVVQAGTGTGKSLAYAVPAALSGRKVVVATATKALQEQLATKDLPAVIATLEVPVTFAVLKGRSNYLCLQRASEVGGRGYQQALDDPEEAALEPEMSAEVSAEMSAEASAEADAAPDGPLADDHGRLVDQVRHLLGWAQSTETGDRGDLSFEPHPRAWAMVSVGPRECPGAQRCPSGARCFAERARRRAADADVVVVNTHLYGAHVASGGTVLPEHDVVVFDEAHELETVMTASLGVELAPGRLAAVHTAARPVLRRGGSGSSTDLGEVAERIRAALGGRTGER
ncbi:MAG: ATP-dependent DNA helicase, partial [Acidimicrobiales bacterium]